MALTREQAVIRAHWRARRLIGQMANQMSYEDFDSFHDDALNRLAERNVGENLEGGDHRLVAKSVPNISGSSNIFPVPSNIVVRSIESQGTVTANGGTGTGNPLQYKPNLEDVLYGGLSPNWEYYTIAGGGNVGGALHLYKSDGSVFSPPTINIRAAVYPQKAATASGVFTDLPVQLENEYIDLLVEVALEKFTQMVGGQAPPMPQSAQST